MPTSAPHVPLSVCVFTEYFFPGEIRRSDVETVLRNGPKISIVSIDGSEFGDIIHSLEASPMFFHMSGKFTSKYYLLLVPGPPLSSRHPVPDPLSRPR